MPEWHEHGYYTTGRDDYPLTALHGGEHHVTYAVMTSPYSAWHIVPTLDECEAFSDSLAVELGQSIIDLGESW